MGCAAGGALRPRLQPLTAEWLPPPPPPLCAPDRKKLLWYVGKGLAVQVCEEPLTVQLTFQHKTNDQQQGTAGGGQRGRPASFPECSLPSGYGQPGSLGAAPDHELALSAAL